MLDLREPGTGKPDAMANGAKDPGSLKLRKMGSRELRLMHQFIIDHRRGRIYCTVENRDWEYVSARATYSHLRVIQSTQVESKLDSKQALRSWAWLPDWEVDQ